MSNNKTEEHGCVTIDGVKYLVIRERPFEVDGKQRTSLFLKRPKGKRSYHAIRYENGSVSSAV